MLPHSVYTTEKQPVKYSYSTIIAHHVISLYAIEMAFVCVSLNGGQLNK